MISVPSKHDDGYKCSIITDKDIVSLFAEINGVGDIYHAFSQSNQVCIIEMMNHRALMNMFGMCEYLLDDSKLRISDGTIQNLPDRVIDVSRFAFSHPKADAIDTADLSAYDGFKTVMRIGNAPRMFYAIDRSLHPEDYDGGIDGNFVRITKKIAHIIAFVSLDAMERCQWKEYKVIDVSRSSAKDVMRCDEARRSGFSQLC